MTPPPIFVLISGSGTNLQALIDATKSEKLNAEIVHVVSNRKNAYGLTRAKEANIPTTYHNLVPYRKKHPDTDAGINAARESYDTELAHLITTYNPKPVLVVCAGWMHILSAPFIDALHAAHVGCINLHPALPGKFDGVNAIGRAWEAFQRGEIAGTGVMVHHVINEVDAGQPIITKTIECIAEEPESGLEERIHKIEWGVIVEGTAMALKEIEEGKGV